jgi:saccharopine dehydrogenase-like NADP-dependent oxidoreductase
MARVLLIGVGAVGEAFAVLANRKKNPWFELMVLADYNTQRAQEVATLINSPRYVAHHINARNVKDIADLIRKFKITLVMNACDPSFVEPIFDACYETNSKYFDMAMSLSVRHKTQPYKQIGPSTLGQYQFEQHKNWENSGNLAVIGIGVEPGLSNVFAKYAQKHLFSKIEEIGVRDGSNLVVEGYDFAPTFSIFTLLEECLNPPIIWEKGRGLYVTEAFSQPEIFDFPELGPLECVNVEHEEVVLIPRVIDCNRVTFKYALGNEFIGILKTIETLGMDSTEYVDVKGVKVRPRDVLSAILPDPAKIGPILKGKTCAGTWVQGLGKDGKPREVYLYQICDNEVTMKNYNVQAVVWQTAIPALIAMELVATGVWKGKGVLGAESFDPDPFLALMPAYEMPYGVKEMVPRTKSSKL